MSAVNVQPEEEPSNILSRISKSLLGKNTSAPEVANAVELNEPQVVQQEGVPKNNGNNPMEVKNNKRNTRNSKYRRNTRRTNKTENSVTFTPLTPAEREESEKMNTFFNTVPDFIKSLQEKKDLLTELYDNHINLTEIPAELKSELEQLKELSMTMPMAIFQTYVQHHGIMNFEKGAALDEFMDFDSPAVSISTRNGMKLGWIALLQVLPLEKLVGM